MIPARLAPLVLPDPPGRLGLQVLPARLDLPVMLGHRALRAPEVCKVCRGQQVIPGPLDLPARLVRLDLRVPLARPVQRVRRAQRARRGQQVIPGRLVPSGRLVPRVQLAQLALLTRAQL